MTDPVVFVRFQRWNVSDISSSKQWKLVFSLLVDLLIEWCFSPLSAVFHGDSSHYSFLSWVSPALGRGFEVVKNKEFT